MIGRNGANPGDPRQNRFGAPAEACKEVRLYEAGQDPDGTLLSLPDSALPIRTRSFSEGESCCQFVLGVRSVSARSTQPVSSSIGGVSRA